ncbi:vitamin K epoxide reductase family protein [Actinomycetota bacterium Odt1-20B]
MPSATRTASPAPPTETPAAPARGCRPLGLLLLVAGAVGTLASAVLTYDRIQSLANPAFSPGCNINAVLSCTDVMTTWQSNLFGFPNMLLGIAGFAVLGALGLVLAVGAVFPRWLWLCVQAAVTGAFAFVVWLASQCLYVIGALCPWCMLVWAVTIPVFWCVTVRSLRTRALPAPSWLVRALAPRYAWLGLALIYGVLTALVLIRFGDQLL